MKAILRKAGLIAVAAAAVGVFSASTAQASAQSTWAGCPDGYVCVYPEGQNPAVSPSLKYYTYGAHNLSGQYNFHWVLNNQTGGAHARECTGYDGTGDCSRDIAAGWGLWDNLTPINSIVLVQP